MTAVHVGDDAFIFDAGLFLPPIVELEEPERQYNEKKLRSIGALPSDTILDRLGLRAKVRALLIGHAHLDHVGATPYIAQRYKADIYGTPFTIEVMRSLFKDAGFRIKNNVKIVQPNATVKLKSRAETRAEFINITHSTLQTALIALHTKQGTVLYANDFKFDNSPVLGKKPNYEALRRLCKDGVKLLIVDSLYSNDHKKTPSEKIARGLLEDVLLTTENENAGIVVTTFSSHIARLKSIVDCGKKLNRKIVFIGRSLGKYVKAAMKIGMCPFKQDITLVSYRSHVERIFRKIEKNRKRYLVVCTGHQGEPGSILERLSRGEFAFKLGSRDHVIFSSKTIPNPMNMENKARMEKRLRARGVRIFDEVHVSGHAAREDLRDFINMINPEHIIPAHGEQEKLVGMIELAKELGYRVGKEVHLLKDHDRLRI